MNRPTEGQIRNVKSALRDPGKTASDLWPESDSTERQNFVSLAERHRALRKTLKTLQKNKSACSREFKGASAAEKTELRQKMQSISLALNETEDALKSVASEIEKLIDTQLNTNTAAPIPLTFMHWRHTPGDPGADPVAILHQATAGDDWNRYIDSHPAGHFYLRSDVLADIAKLGRHRLHLYSARNKNDEICGVFPVVEMKSALFGHFAVNVPYFNYGGAIGDTPEIESALIDASRGLLIGGCSHVEIRDVRERQNFPGKSEKASMLLNLPDSAASLFESFPAKLRAQIRKAQRADLHHRTGSSELINDFYRVFSIHMRDLGTPVYSPNFFLILLRNYPDHCSLHVLYSEGAPVAGAFLLKDRDLMQIPWASTLRKANHLNANMLLYWHVLEYTIDQKCTWFDFGRSTIDAGTYRFKQQWGAQPVQHHWHYCLNEGEALPAINPDNPRFKLLIAVWQRLPVWLTRIIGPPIVINIP